MLEDRTILKTTADSQHKRITTYNNGAMFKPSLTNSTGIITINTTIDSLQIMAIMAAMERTTIMTSITAMIIKVTTTIRLSRTINRMIIAIGEKIKIMVEAMAGISMTSDRAKVISQRRTITEEIHIKQTINLTLLVPLKNLKIR